MGPHTISYNLAIRKAANSKISTIGSVPWKKKKKIPTIWKMAVINRNNNDDHYFAILNPYSVSNLDFLNTNYSQQVNLAAN